jgi:hypothetical protein
MVYIRGQRRQRGKPGAYKAIKNRTAKLQRSEKINFPWHDSNGLVYTVCKTLLNNFSGIGGSASNFPLVYLHDVPDFLERTRFSPST